MKLSPLWTALTGLTLGAGLLGVGVASCARQKAPKSARPSLLDSPAATATFRTPAVWRYHPARESNLGARLDLPGGAILLAGDRGERWLAEKKSGRITAAARLAPERLVFVMKRDDRFIFVGQEGTSYEAEEALGPFVRSSAPLDRLARVSAAAGSIVGVTRGSKLVHSHDGGATWNDVGPYGIRFIDVEITEARTGLALAVPEAWHVSKDAGATWTKSDISPVGGVRLRRRGKDEIYVELPWARSATSRRVVWWRCALCQGVSGIN